MGRYNTLTELFTAIANELRPYVDTTQVEYTNLIADDLSNVYLNTGWSDGSNAAVAKDGYVMIEPFSVSVGDVIRINVTIDALNKDGSKINFYNKNDVCLNPYQRPNIDTYINLDIGSKVATLSVANVNGGVPTSVRIVLYVKDTAITEADILNLIITKNEELPVAEGKIVANTFPEKIDEVYAKGVIDGKRVITANLQEKTITPTEEIQTVQCDSDYEALSKVTVNAIPQDYIIPSGDVNITKNGTYNVSEKAQAIVNIDSGETPSAFTDLARATTTVIKDNYRINSTGNIGSSSGNTVISFKNPKVGKECKLICRGAFVLNGNTNLAAGTSSSAAGTLISSNFNTDSRLNEQGDFYVTIPANKSLAWIHFSFGGLTSLRFPIITIDEYIGNGGFVG